MHRLLSLIAHVSHYRNRDGDREWMVVTGSRETDWTPYSSVPGHSQFPQKCYNGGCSKTKRLGCFHSPTWTIANMFAWHHLNWISLNDGSDLWTKTNEHDEFIHFAMQCYSTVFHIMLLGSNWQRLLPKMAAIGLVSKVVHKGIGCHLGCIHTFISAGFLFLFRYWVD